MRRWIAIAIAGTLAACSSAPGSDGGPPDAAVASDLATAPDAATADLADRCGPIGPSWSRCAADPVARAGSKEMDGRYELAIGDPDVQYDAAAGLWRAWWSTTLATDYAGPAFQLGIKYAESPDGIAWQVQPAPAILASATPSDWDSSKLETPTVLHLPSNPPGTRFLLFYSGADANERAVNGTLIPWYQIGAATSDDGKSFTRIDATNSPYGKAGLVLEGKDAFPGLAGVADGLVADPEIVFDGATLHLLYSSLAVDGAGMPLWFGIGHATSTDGLTWTPDAATPIAALYGGKGPSVVSDGSGGWELYFQRDSAQDLAAVPSTFNPQLGIWRSSSADLSAWSATGSARELTWDGALPAETYGWIAVGDMAHVGGEYRYYYPAFSALAPPAADWLVPTQSGLKPSLVVLNLARRN